MAGRSCALEDCGDPTCRLCELARMPQPRSAREAERKAETENPERDGAPKLAGERKRGNLAFQRRKRVGPHR